jgi:uncharacterized protein YkwD
VAVGLVAAALTACAGSELNVVSLPASTTTSTAVPALVATTSTTTPSSTTTTSTSTSTTTTTALTTTTTEAPPPPPPQDLTLAERSLAFVNQKRSENGSGSLAMDPDLVPLAEAWAQELVRSQDLHHNPNLGDQVPDGFHTWGENVAYSSEAEGIDELWWNSDGHRANILNPAYTSVGIAFVEDSSGVTWAVQVFAG